MGCMTDSDRNVLVQIPLRIRTQVLCCYLSEGMTQKQIAQAILGKPENDPWAAEIVSTILRAYGFHQGKQRGKYHQIPQKITAAFVRTYLPERFLGGLDEGTYDEFLRSYVPDEEDEDEYIEEVSCVPQARRAPQYHAPQYHAPRQSAAPSRNWDFSFSDLPLAGIGAVILAVVLLMGIPSLFNAGKSLISSGKSLFSDVGSFVSTEYELEIFTYQNIQYVGNQRLNKPDGLCFRRDGGGDYAMGDFGGKKLDGYGVVVGQNGELIQIGTFKNSKLNGYGICRGGEGVFYVGKFKNGTLKGYGYCYNNGTEQIVKFKSIDADNAAFSGSVKVIAQKIGGGWYTPNGKTLKMKNSTYKGITCVSDGRIRIDDREFSFAGGNAHFTSSDMTLSYRPGSASYNNSGKGLQMEYNAGSGVSVHHTVREGASTATKIYSASFSNN